MSPFLAFVGLSVAGTWGLGSIGLIVGGIFLLVDPADNPAAVSGNTLPAIVLIVLGFLSMGVMQVTIMPLLGIDPPLPIKARSIIPNAKLTRWVKAAELRDLPDGTPKEVRVRGKRVLLIREGATAHAMGALCSHARLPLGGLPGSPIKAEAVRDGCVMCPFHGARFEVGSGKVVRQPFDSQFNQQHPILGGLQSKLFRAISAPPVPPMMPKPSMNAEDQQTYPCRIEDGNVMVALPPK